MHHLRSGIFFSVIFIMVSALVACSKDEKKIEPHTNTFSAKINNSPFQATEIEVVTSGSTIGVTVNIYARASNNHQIFLNTRD